MCFLLLFCSQVSEMEETMLSVLRPSQKTTDSVISSPTASTRLPLDPSELPPDKLHVELELSPDSQITLYGPLLKAFLSIKVGRGARLVKFMGIGKRNNSFWNGNFEFCRICEFGWKLFVGTSSSLELLWCYGIAGMNSIVTGLWEDFLHTYIYTPISA